METVVHINGNGVQQSTDRLHRTAGGRLKRGQSLGKHQIAEAEGLVKAFFCKRYEGCN